LIKFTAFNLVFNLSSFSGLSTICQRHVSTFDFRLLILYSQLDTGRIMCFLLRTVKVFIANTHRKERGKKNKILHD